jgi:hypothetical protein
VGKKENDGGGGRGVVLGSVSLCISLLSRPLNPARQLQVSSHLAHRLVGRAKKMGGGITYHSTLSAPACPSSTNRT